MASNEPERLRRIQHAHWAVTELEKAAQGRDLTSREQLELLRAYADRGALRSTVSSPEAGLHDLLRAYALSGTAPNDVRRVITSFSGESPKPMALARKLFQQEFTTKIDARRQEAYERFGATTQAVRKSLARSAQTDGRSQVLQPETFPLPPYTPDAELGEAFRIDARDHLLSQLTSDSTEADIQDLIDAAHFSIASFDRALTYCRASARSRDVAPFRAWILAHRAATFTLLYWIARASRIDSIRSGKFEPGEQRCVDWLFDRADDDFVRALEERPNYAWCMQFRAFLLGLRGHAATTEMPSDFARARNMLRVAQDAAAAASAKDAAATAMGSTGPVAKGGSLQSSFSRSLAMLYSYDAASASSSEDKIEAAERSIEAGLDAVRTDPDEFLGAYFAVTSQWFLAKKCNLPDDDKAAYEANLQSSIDAARVRARNALSQALTALAGLQDLQELLDGAPLSPKTTPAYAAEPTNYYEALGKFSADLESRAIFARDPVGVYASDNPRIADRRHKHLEALSARNAMKLVQKFWDDEINPKTSTSGAAE